MPWPPQALNPYVATHTYDRRAWLPFERPNNQLKESDADTKTQPMDGSWGLLWLNWGKSWKKLRRRAAPWEGQSQLTWTPDISQALTEPPTRQHIPADMRPLTHIQQRIVWSGLGERRCTNSQET